MIPPQERAELEGEATGTSQALATLEAYAITDAASLAYAEAALVAAETRWREIEARRTAITKPINEAKRQVDALFGPVLKPLKAVSELLRGKVGAYAAAQVQAQGRAMLAVAAGVPGAALVVPVDHVGGISTKVKWRFRIVDADAVPRDLCSPDEKKIAASIWYADTPHAPPRAVAGLEFYLDGALTVRTA